MFNATVHAPTLLFLLIVLNVLILVVVTLKFFEATKMWFNFKSTVWSFGLSTIYAQTVHFRPFNEFCPFTVIFLNSLWLYKKEFYSAIEVKPFDPRYFINRRDNMKPRVVSVFPRRKHGSSPRLTFFFISLCFFSLIFRFCK